MRRGASNRPSLAKTDALLACLADKLELLSEKTNAHRDWITSVAFSPDGTKIVSGSIDGTIKVWDSGAPRALKIAPPWPKLTPVGLSGRQAGAAEREDAEREDKHVQRHHQVGGVFPGWDEDCVWIRRRDDQSLGFRCAGALKSSLLGRNCDACWLAWQTSWSC